MQCHDLSKLNEQSIVTLYNELLHTANAHLSWLHKFNKSLLIEHSSLDELLHAQGHTLCVFGNWLPNSPKLLNTIKSLNEILHEHQAMHDYAHKLAHQKNILW